MSRSAFLAILALCFVPSICRAEIDFSRDVQPILAEHCFACHGADTAESGLRLDLREAALQAADSGDVAIAPHDVAASQLLHRVRAIDEAMRMPPEGDRLEPQQIRVLEEWIASGAEWNEHWAYRTLDSGRAPATNDTAWLQNSLDSFVLARLEEAQISPSEEPSREKLIRRLSYDLLGLPPSVRSVQRFVEDKSADAYEQLVDSMLASPRFGERWGRHWLDKARYADSDGYEKDRNRPHAWRYREWVINAINSDMPFDQFTIQQLAGDLLPNATDDQILATAFHRQTLTNTEGGTDQEQWRVAAVMDRTETLGTVWLGLTVGCARCHNHKYDQITQAEYYQLYAFFNNADEAEHHLPPTSGQLTVYQQQVREYEMKLAAKRAELEMLTQQKPVNSNQVSDTPKTNSTETPAAQSDKAKAMSDRIKKLKNELAKLEKNRPQRPRFDVRVVARRDDERRITHILRRGEFKQPLQEVTPGTLSTLPAVSESHDVPERLRLARWLVDSRNPLVARVSVNQIWQRLFGQGLVTTPNDFGVRGELPSHPRLLDHLAAEYIRLEWSRKALIRKIVLSATYRQSSNHRPELVDIDPNNRLLYRQNRFRLEAESIRDATLAVAGLLSNKIGGPSVFPPMPAEAAAVSYANNFKWATSRGEDRFRRGMYTYFKRTAPHPTLTTFDCPDANVTNVKRNRSNTPIGALVLLNNTVYSEAAVAFARRTNAIAGDEAARLRWAFRRCMSREPTPRELNELVALLESARAHFAANAQQAAELTGEFEPEAESQKARPNNGQQLRLASETASWAVTLRVLLNLDEFITRD